MSSLGRLALRNLGRNPRKSIATMLSIALGAGGLLFTFGYVVRGERFLRVAQIYALHTGHLAVYKTGGLERSLADPARYNLSPAEQSQISDALAGDPNVVQVGTYLVAAGLMNNGCESLPYRALGVQPEVERWAFSQPEAVAHTPEQVAYTRGDGPWHTPPVPGAITMSGKFAELIGKPRVLSDVGELPPTPPLYPCGEPGVAEQIAASPEVQLLTSTFDGGFTALDATIIGQFHPGFTEFERSAVVMPLDALQALHQTDTATYMAVWLHEADDIDARAAALQLKLQGEGLGVQVYPWSDPAVAPNYVSNASLMGIMGSFIYVVVTSVVALAIVNTMTITILERRAELGMLRSLGFTRGQVRRVLLLETLALTGAGALLGLVFGYGGAAGVNAANIRFDAPSVSGRWQFMVEPNLAVGVFIGLSLMALAAASAQIAASRALRENITHLLQTSTR